MNQKVLIVANGKIASESRLREAFLKFAGYELLSEHFIVICADGGIRNARLLSLKINYLIGDFDSASTEEREALSKDIDMITIFDPDQNKTDTRLAVELALKLQAREIFIIGATGGRMDHCLSNILELKHLDNLDTARVIDEYSDIRYTRLPVELNGHIGETISIIPLSDVKALSYEGLMYPLHNADIPSGTSLICNKFSQAVARIDFKSGELLIIKAYD